jgi:hypothetical protein
VTTTPELWDDLEVLRSQLEEQLLGLRGSWISRQSHYEGDCANALGGTLAASTYWDCTLDSGMKIELKKTQNGGMWFDLVRYSKVILDPELAADVVTLILRYRLLPTPAVTHIAVILHDDLLKALRLDQEKARGILNLEHGLPRALNAQARLSWSDLTAAARFVVG